MSKPWPLSRIRPSFVVGPLTILAVAGCHASPDTGLSPTPPSAVLSDAGIQHAVFAPADLGGCLAGSAWAGCFSGNRMQAFDATSAPVTSAPLNLSGSVNGTTVSIVWTAPGLQDAAILSYVIEVGSTPNFASPNLANLDTGNASTTLTAPGVPIGTYYVRVRARNALGLSAPSNEIVIIVGGSPGTCPGAPRSLSANRLSNGTVTLSWLAPLTGSAHSYVVEAGSSPGLANMARVNVGGTGVSFAGQTVPAGTYYLRVYAQTTGCPTSPPSNEVQLMVPGATGSLRVTLRLSYSCSRCTGDSDNYSLNVACVRGRCTTFRTSNPFRSGVITATVRLAPGTYETEVVARQASWTLTATSDPGGGIERGSFVPLFPSPSSALVYGACSISGHVPEAVFTMRVRAGGPGTVC